MYRSTDTDTCKSSFAIAGVEESVCVRISTGVTARAATAPGLYIISGLPPA